MSKEHDATREALAKELVRASGSVASEVTNNKLQWRGWERMADYILAREAEREGPLVEALEAIGRKQSQCADHGGPFCGGLARAALARYRALDAPPQRTLAEVAKDVVAWRAGNERGSVLARLMDELAEALKREEGKR